MAESQIQYTKTSDGVNIAYASMGEGPPLVGAPLAGFAHSQRNWEMFPHLQPLTRTFRVILYDPRGTSLSDRDAIDFSMEAMMRDLEAVIDRTGLRSFAIMAVQDAVPIAITYAATFPDRVTHLILTDGWTNSSDFTGMPAFEAHEALIDSDWTLYTETLARVLSGVDDPSVAAQLGEHFRACIEPAAYRAFVAAAKNYDVSAFLPDVKAETLVLHNNNSRFVPVRVGQKIAAGIPDARFLAIDDMTYDRIAPLVEEFAGTQKPVSVEPSALRTVLFTDIVGHTEMMQRLGDEKGRDVLREHERITRETLKEFGGDEVKTMGDGFMASFGSVTKAMDCAIALQRALEAWNVSLRSQGGPSTGSGRTDELKVRIGLNAGEPIEEDGDLFGSMVILASRIAAKAGGGEILIPEPVRHLLTGKSCVYADRGETVLKGFEDAVRLYEVRWRE